MAIWIVIFDVFALMAFGSSCVIALTGGGRFEVMDHTIRAHSVGNLLVALTLWAAVRYRLRHIPLLRIPTLRLDDVTDRALDVTRALCARLHGLPAPRASAIVWTLAAMAAAVKVSLVIAHSGFFSGDDVEVHEMTLGALFREPWPVWELRSAFYPMALIYPFQRLAFSGGVTDTAGLVAAARLVVIALSTAAIVAVFAVGRMRLGQPAALIGAFLFATSSLHITFGATELPRPVAALFILGAYACLSHRAGLGVSLLGGVLLGVAACLRFSEAVFLVPALVHLGLQRRWLHGIWMTVAFSATAASIQFLSDLWYWGQPFYSARAIVSYTLLDRLSSRGYDPWWYYAWDLTGWSDLLVVALALFATRRNPALSVWVWLPIVLLSMLAHKEPRYLIPVGPMLSMLAALGLVAMLRELPSWRASRAGFWALALLVALSFRTLDQTSKYHVVRTDREVHFAQRMALSLTERAVVAEQAWRFGGRLYLGRGRAVYGADGADWAPASVTATITATSPGLVLVSASTCASHQCDATLSALGFAEQRDADALAFGYRVFSVMTPGQ